VLRSLGKADEARRLLERALGITEAAYGPEHPALATRLNNLGWLLRDLGKSDEARPLFERALRIKAASPVRTPTSGSTDWNSASTKASSSASVTGINTSLPK